MATSISRSNSPNPERASLLPQSTATADTLDALDAGEMGSTAKATNGPKDNYGIGLIMVSSLPILSIF
jgi:hypothetical protein